MTKSTRTNQNESAGSKWILRVSQKAIRRYVSRSLWRHGRNCLRRPTIPISWSCGPRRPRVRACWPCVSRSLAFGGIGTHVSDVESLAASRVRFSPSVSFGYCSIGTIRTETFKITNFFAAFYPFPLSVFVAFLPDMERSEKMRPVWRIGIVGAGLVYSLILWHQQSVNLASSRRDQLKIVADAVQLSNDHADKKIDGVRSDVDGVRKDVAKVSSDLRASSSLSEKRITGLDSTVGHFKESLSESLSKTESSLTKSIGNIALPPTKIGALVFSVWQEKATLKSPALALDLSSASDGTFEIPFTIGNPTSNAVNGADMFIDICTVCTFAEEPKEFLKVDGTSEQTRVKKGDLNPGTNLPRMTMKVKYAGPFPRFAVTFRYSCDICGSMLEREPQTAVITVKR